MVGWGWGGGGGAEGDAREGVKGHWYQATSKIQARNWKL